MPKVSVIIPVYNVEKYLRECLDSVVNQTLKDIEIICINDGSTDGSLEILKEYAKNDERIILINQENSGVSVARNVGVEASKAEFIMFLDSDDKLDIQTIENTYKIITEKKYDILCFGNYICESGKLYESKMTKNLKTIKDFNSLSRMDFILYLNTVTSKIYKSSFLKKNKIFSPQNIVVSEDGIFNLLCVYSGATFGYDSHIYYYTTLNRENSATEAKISSIKNEIISDKYLLNSQEFKNLSDENLILLSFEKIIENIKFYYNRPNSKKYHLLYDYQIQKFTKFLYKNYDSNLLNKCENIKFLKNSDIRKNILSMNYSKDKKHKIYTLLGKIKIKLKQKINDEQNYTKIPIVFSCDDNYVPHLCGAIASILINKKDNVIPCFYVLNAGLSENNKKKISKLKKINAFEINYICVDSSKFKDAPITVTHISLSTYYRYLIAEIIQEYDKVIYLDSDLNVLSDLTELYNTKLSDYYCAGVIDIFVESNTERLSIEKYVNAGVLLLNLKKIRQDGIVKKLFDYTKENSDILKWQDQDVINVVMQEGLIYIDKIWNAQVGMYKRCKTEGFNAIADIASIIHYIGHDKPWLEYSTNPFKDIYWKYMSYTPFKYLKMLNSVKRMKNNIFSIEDSKDKKHKVITIFGIKINHKKRDKNAKS